MTLTGSVFKSYTITHILIAKVFNSLINRVYLNMENKRANYEYHALKNQKLIQKLSSRWGFRFFSFQNLPILWFSGVSVHEVSERSVSVKLPYRWSTKNPFRSVYFAAQAAAAEISTGLPFFFPVQHYGNISMLVKGMRAEFKKKARTDLIFECDQAQEIAEFVSRVFESGEGEELEVRSVGRDQENDIVSEFYFIWTLKRRN